MTILSRYIFRQATGAVLLILISLTVVVWVAVAMRQLEVLTSQGQSGLVFLKMTFLALPTLMGFIAPLAVLIACLQTLGRLNGDSELIVMTAGGASTWRLLGPLMALGLCVAAGVTYINHIAAPWSHRLLRDYSLQIRTDLITQVLQPGRFTAAEPNLTIHMRDRSPDGKLLGMLMHDARDPKQISSYLAETGTIIKQPTAVYLLMENGHILRRTSADAPPDVIVFEKYAIDIQRFEQKTDTSTLVRPPRERSTQDLLNPNPNDPLYKFAPGRFRSELHDRISGPLYPIAFVLLVIAFVGQASTTRENRTKSMIAGFCVAFGCRIGGIGAANAAVINPAATPLLYAIPIGAALVAIFMISSNMRPRPKPLWMQAWRQRRLALVQRVASSLVSKKRQEAA
jgi:lipopolysaccharide export system permease protein